MAGRLEYVPRVYSPDESSYNNDDSLEEVELVANPKTFIETDQMAGRLEYVPRVYSPDESSYNHNDSLQEVELVVNPKTFIETDQMASRLEYAARVYSPDESSYNHNDSLQEVELVVNPKPLIEMNQMANLMGISNQFSSFDRPGYSDYDALEAIRAANYQAMMGMNGIVDLSQNSKRAASSVQSEWCSDAIVADTASEENIEPMNKKQKLEIDEPPKTIQRRKHKNHVPAFDPVNDKLKTDFLNKCLPPEKEFSPEYEERRQRTRQKNQALFLKFKEKADKEYPLDITYHSSKSRFEPKDECGCGETKCATCKRVAKNKASMESRFRAQMQHRNNLLKYIFLQKRILKYKALTVMIRKLVYQEDYYRYFPLDGGASQNQDA